MRHQISGRSFGRLSAQKKALFRGLATSLINEERITTTQAKAKELKRYIEPIVTLAKRGDLHARRQVAGKLYTKEVLQKLFADIGPRFKNRDGGYTRIFKLTPRHGDAAPMAIIEFVDKADQKEEGTKKASSTKAAPKKAAAKKAKPKGDAKKETKKAASSKSTTKKVAPKKTAAKKATKAKPTVKKTATKSKKV